MFTRDNHKTHFFTEESDPVGLLIADDSQILEWNLEAKHLVGTVDAET